MAWRRVGLARLRREGDVVDDVAAIGGQRHAVDGLGVGRARLGELAGDAADLHHRHAAGIGHHHGHLQEGAEEVADVVGAVLGEAFGAVAALQQEGLALCDFREGLLEIARLTRKNEWRKARQALLDLRQRRLVLVDRHLQDRFRPPARRAPTLAHDYASSRPPARKRLRAEK
jgi:hypothetical protein